MIGAEVDVVRGGWGADFARRIERQIPHMLEESAEVGARTASQAMTRRRTGRAAEMEVVPVTRTSRGFAGGFRSKAWYAGFQSSGTLGSRKRKVGAATSARRRSASGQARLAKLGSSGGIPPLGFLEKGSEAMRRHFVLLLDRL